MKYITKLATGKGRCLSALWCSWETWQTQYQHYDVVGKPGKLSS